MPTNCYLDKSQTVLDLALTYLVLSVHLPGRRPWEMDHAGDSTASDVAVVTVFLFGHVDGKERTAGNPRDGIGGGASTMEAPRLRLGTLARKH
jgi:hypothetical protein